MADESNCTPAINLFCVICDRNRREKVRAAIQPFAAYLNLMASGRGTANTRILNYLGLGEAEKTIFWNLMPAAAAAGALEAVHGQLQLAKPGHGVAFRMGIRQGCYHKSVPYQSNTNGGEPMQPALSQPHQLIFTVLNRGYGEEVMTVARAAGATGGTLLHARAFGGQGMEKFLGVEITAEKELLMILARADGACDIMNAVAAAVGPDTDAGAVSFSLPVEDVRGLREDGLR